MAFDVTTIIDILAEHDIAPYEDKASDIDLPGIGQVQEGESIYSTSISRVLREGEESLDGGYEQQVIRPRRGIFWDDLDEDERDPNEDERLKRWREDIEQIVRGKQVGGSKSEGLRQRIMMPAESPCAWYSPIHFFGHAWGIYIREDCVLSKARDIAEFVHWPSVRTAPQIIPLELLRSAFYELFLHEQFHHKVESLGFRLLVSTGTDRYRPYKRNVYRKTYLSADCLEESLANAESYNRLTELRYKGRVDPAIREGLQKYLKASFALQPPGYREGSNYLSAAKYRAGLYNLQSQILDGKITPSTAPSHWSIAPNMITSLADIADNIYVVLPRGARPLFRPTDVDLGATVSSRNLEGALIRHYGYKPVSGGKGSHVKLKKPDAPTIILPGNRQVVSPGVVRQALAAVGRHPISRLPDFLEGRL